MTIKLLNPPKFRKYQVNSNIFLKEDDISFYLLGAYMTDGCINDKKHHLSFSISSKDLDWIENIRNLICPNKPIYNKKKIIHYDFQASDINCMNWLIDNSCTPRKSKTLYIKNIPEKYQRDFIRGCIDGDGSLSNCIYTKIKNGKIYTYTKHTAYLCSASEKFLIQIKEMIPKTINCNIINTGIKDSQIINRKINIHNNNRLHD